MCFDPWMWTFSSAEIPPHHHGSFWMGRSNQMFPTQLWSRAVLWADASTRKFKIKMVSVWSGEAASHPPSLFPFLSSVHSCLPSVSPGFIYRLRNCRGGDGGRDGKHILKLEDSLLPEERIHSPPLSSLSLTFLTLCSHCSSPSWSLPQLLSERVLKIPNVKNPTLSGWTQQTGNSLLALNVVYFF